jgi:hypothetical protein
MARLLIAVETFVTERRGRSEIVSAGELAEHGSWPVELHPAAFRVAEVRWKAPVAPKSETPASEPDLDPVLLSSPPASPKTLKHRGGGGRSMSQPT